MRRAAAALLAAVAIALASGAAFASAFASAPHATPLWNSAEPPRVEFAQRALRRPVEAPVDTVGHLPGGAADRKSRGLAVALAAIAPGAGQLYLGQRHGYAQLGAEALAWFAFASLQTSAHDKRDQYAAFVGDATAAVIAPANHWQFDRYCPTPADCDTTDYNDLLRQWQNDRTRFFESVTDPRYSRGWSDTTSAGHYDVLREQANRMLRLSRYATAAVVVNHVISLIDAVQGSRHLAVSDADTPRVRVEWAVHASGDGRAALVYRF